MNRSMVTSCRAAHNLIGSCRSVLQTRKVQEILHSIEQSNLVTDWLGNIRDILSTDSTHAQLEYMNIFHYGWWFSPRIWYPHNTHFHDHLWSEGNKIGPWAIDVQKNNHKSRPRIGWRTKTNISPWVLPRTNPLIKTSSSPPHRKRGLRQRCSNGWP